MSCSVPVTCHCFPTSIPSSNVPNFELLGVPIGETAFCSSFIARKCSSPSALLSHLECIGSSDPHVALTLLRHCASFCKLIHLDRGTPSSSAVEALKDFDLAVANCFIKCTGLDISVDAWKQAQLSPHRGGLGLRPLSLHAQAAFISSLCSSDSATPSHSRLTSSVTLFNNCVPLSEAVSVHSLLSNPPSQRHLSVVIETHSLLAYTTACPVLTKYDFSQCPPLTPLPGPQSSLLKSWDFTSIHVSSTLQSNGSWV